MQQMEEKFPTCALAVIHFDLDRWKDVVPEEGALKRFVTPANLTEK